MENIYPAIGNVTRIEYGGQPVISTARLAEFYECTDRNIRQNFNNNADRFIAGKHFFKLEGDALRVFKRDVENFDIADNVNALYLWTKRGCARQNAIRNVELGIRNGYAALIPHSSLLIPNCFQCR